MGTNKTWKREVAFLMFLWLVYVSIWGTVPVLELIIWPAILFIGGAYGVDAYYKNNAAGLDVSGLLGKSAVTPTKRT